MSSLKIKVCGMRETENIRQLAECRPDFMGMVFYPKSPRFAGDVPGERMLASFPESIIKTGVFVDADLSFMYSKTQMFGLQAVQLHGYESPEICNQLMLKGLMVIKAFRINEHTDFSGMANYLACTNFFLFDTASDIPGGSGKGFNWELLDKYQLAHPFFLSGGIGPEDAERIISLNHKALSGVDINSRFETEPGVKDIKKVKDFIDIIKTK